MVLFFYHVTLFHRLSKKIPDGQGHMNLLLFSFFIFVALTRGINSYFPREDAGGLSPEYVLRIPSVS